MKDAINLLDQKLAEREKLDQEITRLKKEQRAERLAVIRADVKRFDITADEIFGGTKARPAAAARKTRAAVAAKYFDPETGKTWSGRGREPKWLAGKNRDEFLI